MRIISVLTALALTQTGILSAQESGNNTLISDPLYKEAIEALTDYLPTIASQKFNLLLKQKLKDKSLSKDEHLKLIFLLAEAQVRANKPQDAIQSLSNKLIKENPDAVFWRGHALAASGQYQSAIETLEKANPKSKNYQLGQLKSANLAIALGDLDKALSTLKLSIKNSKNVTTQSYLSLANLYIAKQEPANATSVLSKVKSTETNDTRAKQIMLAQVDILNEKYSIAIGSLEKILSEENLQFNTQNFAAIQLADALHANGQNQDAINTLIKYLDKQPDQQISSMFTRLGQWLPNDTPITGSTVMKLMEWANLNIENTTEAISPLTDPESDLSAFAHYYYAKFLSNKPEPTDKIRAVQEFETLRLRYPSHILAGSSLSNSASTLLSLNRIEEAKEILKTIQNLTTPIAPQAKQQASLLLAKLNRDDKNYAEAAIAYQSIIESTANSTRETATMNAAISYLAASDTEGFNKLQKSTQAPNIKQNLKLEHALWSTRNKQPNARVNLHDFAIKHPEHPRINEAYLSLALHCLSTAPVDLKLANLIAPRIAQHNLSDDQKVDFHYLQYRNAVTLKDFAAAANIAKRFLELFPEHQFTPEFILHQGQALYHNGQHNDARQLLQKMAKDYPKHPLKDFAEYYAAMSTKLEGTPQSAEEAIELLSQISESKSNLATEARLQLARLYIDTNKAEQAVKTLSNVYSEQPKNKKDLNISLTLASAHQSLGDSEEKYFQSALNIYQDLTVQFKDNEQILNKVKYNHALLLQHMENDEQALAIYYSVIKIDPKKTPITEWDYYYRCGFRAISILEAQQNPKAAIEMAKKLTESKGSRAQEAATKARDLEMKYMIWQN